MDYGYPGYPEYPEYPVSDTGKEMNRVMAQKIIIELLERGMLITSLHYPFNQIEKINSGEGHALLICITRLLIPKNRRGASRRLDYLENSSR